VVLHKREFWGGECRLKRLFFEGLHEIYSALFVHAPLVSKFVGCLVKEKINTKILLGFL
jgi:hypothetical protein